jgi:hypothetical protein
MTDFESIIKDAITAQKIPGCALAATSRDGTYYIAPSQYTFIITYNF